MHVDTHAYTHTHTHTLPLGRSRLGGALLFVSEGSVKLCVLEIGRCRGEEEEEEEGGLSAAGFHHSWQPLLSYHGNALQCSLLLLCPPPSLCFLTPSLTPSHLYCWSTSSLCCHDDALSPPQCWSAELNCELAKEVICSLPSFFGCFCFSTFEFL